MKKRILTIITILLFLFLAFLFISSRSDEKNLARQDERTFSEFSNAKPLITIGNLGVNAILRSVDSPVARIQAKGELVQKLAAPWVEKGGDAKKLQSLMQEVGKHGNKGDFVGAEKAIDDVLLFLEASEKDRAMLGNKAEEANTKELDTFIADAKKFNLSGIEDYVAWSVVEKKEGASDWEFYKADASKIKSAGIQFVPFLWIQSLPSWAIHNPKYVLTKNARTGRETEALSLYAPETLRAYDHFYGETKRAFGDKVDRLRIGSPYDFGETAYPAGAASSFFPLTNLEPGFWVGEAPARDHFKQAMQKKYSTITELNTAWHTSFGSFETLEYPTDAKNRRYWLDFIHWYHDGFTEKMGSFADVARKYFPNIPINFNIGLPYEKINLGQSLSGLAKMAGEKKLYLRTPTGPIVPFLYTKHISTAVRHYKPSGFSSEPVDSSASCAQVALALFKDLTTGVLWHFDYAPNLDRCQASLAEYRNVWPKIDGVYPEVETALFFPTTSHFLLNNDNWRPEGFSGGFPEGLQSYAEELRDVTDYDVLDERLIADGFLDSYRVLIWPIGNTVEAVTLQKMRSWVENGGTLLIATLDDVETVEGGAGTFEDLKNVIPLNGIRKVNRGKIVEIGKKVRNLDSEFLTLDAPDGVFTSAFKDGVFVFNNTAHITTKSLTSGKEITLQPYEFLWIQN